MCIIVKELILEFYFNVVINKRKIFIDVFIYGFLFVFDGDRELD